MSVPRIRRKVLTSGEGERQRSRHRGFRVFAAMAAAVVLVCGAADAATDLPTPLGHPTSPESFLDGVHANALDNQVWWCAQDLHSKRKVCLSFNTTSSTLGLPFPHLLVMGVKPNGSLFLGFLPALFKTTDAPATLTAYVPGIGDLAQIAWSPTQRAYHVTFDVTGVYAGNGPEVGRFRGDLWFHGVAGGAAMPTYWDGQTSYLPQTVGAGVASGTVTMPGYPSYAATNWGTDLEPEYGTYLDGTDIYKPADHIGYEWAEAQNPDGSGDLLLAFAERSGVWRGMLTHTTRDGHVTECEPSVRLSNWSTQTTTQPPNLTGAYFPRTITARCAATPTSPPCLARTFSMTTDPQVVPFAVYSFTAAGASGRSNIPGSVAVIQHFREKGSTGITPTWTGTGQPQPCKHYS